MKISHYVLPLLLCICSAFFTGCDKAESETCSDGIMNGDETGIDCGGSCNPCATGNCIAGFTGTGTAVGVSPNNCGDRPITVTNDGTNTVTLNLPVDGAGTLILIGTITSGCSFTIPLDTLSESGVDTYYSGSGSLSGTTLSFTYRADFSFGGGFDCDYSAELQ